MIGKVRIFSYKEGERVKVFITKLDGGGVHVQARLEGEGGTVGDISRELGPTDTFLGWSGAELAALDEGEQEIEPKG